MKKILSLIVVLMLCFNIKAQTSLTEAVNFIANDDQDSRFELFEVLDRGQCVFMYFFFSDASTSPVFDPCVAEAYHHYDDNQKEVFFVGVAPGDDSLSVKYWKDTYDVDFPVIHALAKGGTNAHDICSAYGVEWFSTAVFIAPDRKIMIDNIWPINSSQQLIDEFEAAMATIDVTEIKDNEYSIYPNPASAEINITSQLNGEADVRIYDMSGRCVKETRIFNINNATINISDLDKGVYLVNVNGKVEKLVIE